MKKYAFSIIVLLFFGLTSGCYYNRLTVESDSKNELNHYMSYNILTMPDEFRNVEIENIIKMRMDLQGYYYNEKKPDFAVSYMLFIGNPKFYGYKQETSKELEKRKFLNEKNMPENNKESATLLVSFTDAKKGNVIFQSFVKGVYLDPNQMNNHHLKMAVHHIFDEYKIFAANYYANRDKSHKNVSNLN